MKNKKILVATSCVLVAIIAISTLASTIMQGSSASTWEPLSMHDLTEYPGSVEMRDLTPEEIETEILSLELDGTIKGIPVEGAFELKVKLAEKGYLPTESFFDVLFDVFSEVQVQSPDGLETRVGIVFKGWTPEGPKGSKALIAGAVMTDPATDQNSSIILGTPTNILPPDQVPGVDPYIIVNAEPYFYVQPYWWVWAPWSRLVYWKYWWYDSHKSPNWFWGIYWWWRTYVKYYVVYWDWWWGWWWHWYYWRAWNWWSVYWI